MLRNSRALPIFAAAALGAATCLGAVMACSKGNLRAPTAPDLDCAAAPTLSGCVMPIIEKYGCGKGGCHDGSTEPSCDPMDLTSAAGFYQAMVGVDGCATCFGYTRVIPFDSTNSCMPQLLDFQIMPFDGPPFLTAEEIAIIKAWIDAGAQND
jgi:hypothetical protein